MLLRIPGFPAGTHTDSRGNTREFTEAQLQNCASVYDVSKHEAPVLIGHPTGEQELSEAWVKRVAFEERLTAYAGQLSNFMWEMLRNEQARKYSFSFYLESHPQNPVPGSLYLRHVGIVPVPAIKDNPEPELEFSENEQTLTIDFCESREECFMSTQQDKPQPEKPATDTVAADFAERELNLKRKEAALQAGQRELAEQQAMAQRKETADFVEGLTAEGKVLPRDKGDLVDFMGSMNDVETVNFSEGNKTQREWFKGFLSSLPKQVEFDELAKHPEFKEADRVSDYDTAAALESIGAIKKEA